MSNLEYGQQRQMEDQTMVGTLEAQVEMIWPLERPLLQQLGFGDAEEVADLGCGTGHFAGRLSSTWPHLRITGLDMFEGHLLLAHEAYPPAEYPNVTFEQGDARKTGWDADRFDIVVIRHVLHALPDVPSVLDEARRILRPGGLLYVLAEDYAGLVFDTPGEAAQRLFYDATPGLMPFGTNLFHGRAAFRELRATGYAGVRVHPLVVDTLNTPRETFGRMLRYWRDGYAVFIADALGKPHEDIVDRFESLLLTVLDADRYACWLLFAASARKPMF